MNTDQHGKRGDLGRNGTYIVFRQLSQDVQAFWRFVTNASEEVYGSSEARNRLAGKTTDATTSTVWRVVGQSHLGRGGPMGLSSGPERAQFKSTSPPCRESAPIEIVCRARLPSGTGPFACACTAVLQISF